MGRLGKIAIVILGVVCLSGAFLLGASTFWDEMLRGSAAQPVWPWRLPEMPPEFTAEYRQLIEGVSADVRQVMQVYPNDPDAISALGLLHYLVHDREAEVACWNHCLTVDPRHELAYSRLVASAQQDADYERIVSLMHRALASDPDNPSYGGILGSALMYLNRYQEARDVLEGQLHAGHATADAYHVLGEVCNQMDQLQQARRYFQAAVVLGPRRPDSLFGLMKVYAKLGQADLAADCRKRFQEIKASQLQSEMGRDNTREGLRDAIYAPTQAGEILTYVGKAYRAHGDLTAATRCLEKAASLSADAVECRELLSELAQERQRPQEALRWVGELKRLQPENRLHYRNEGILYARMGNEAEAERVFRDICRLEPARAFGYAALADLFLRQERNLTEARSLAERAVELEPVAPHWALLASIARKSGDEQTARKALEQAAAAGSAPASARANYESAAK